MRSRYTAFTRADIDYVRRTHAPETLGDFDEKATRDWAQNARFTNLKIIRTEEGGPGDSRGIVEFIATFTDRGSTFEHHEVSLFRSDGAGGWLFVSGEGHRHGDRGQQHLHEHGARTRPLVRSTPKTGRNDPCPCASGKKYKKCCGAGT